MSWRKKWRRLLPQHLSPRSMHSFYCIVCESMTVNECLWRIYLVPQYIKANGFYHCPLIFYCELHLMVVNGVGFVSRTKKKFMSNVQLVLPDLNKMIPFIRHVGCIIILGTPFWILNQRNRSGILIKRFLKNSFQSVSHIV